MFALVIASEAVDAGFDENEAELRVLVLAVDLEVFTDRNGLFNEVPEVFWDSWGEAYSSPSVVSSQRLQRRRRKGKEREGKEWRTYPAP